MNSSGAIDNKNDVRATKNENDIDDEDVIVIEKSVVQNLKCNGKYCSFLGVKFDRCLAKVYLVSELCMHEIIKNNPGLSDKVA